MPKYSVLVIDDEKDILKLLQYNLEKEGYRFLSARTGEEGVEAARLKKPDLVVLDLMLPRYGGFEILRRLQQGPLAALPIVVVTGRYNDPATAGLVRAESNVVALLPKPINTDGLTALLQERLVDH